MVASLAPSQQHLLSPLAGLEVDPFHGFRWQPVAGVVDVDSVDSVDLDSVVVGDCGARIFPL